MRYSPFSRSRSRRSRPVGGQAADVAPGAVEPLGVDQLHRDGEPLVARLLAVGVGDGAGVGVPGGGRGAGEEQLGDVDADRRGGHGVEEAVDDLAGRHAGRGRHGVDVAGLLVVDGRAGAGVDDRSGVGQPAAAAEHQGDQQGEHPGAPHRPTCVGRGRRPPSVVGRGGRGSDPSSAASSGCERQRAAAQREAGAPRQRQAELRAGAGRPHAWSQPPCRWVSSSAMESPRPVPPLVRARAGSARQNRLNTIADSPGSSPTP